MAYFPLFQDLEMQKIVILGGGTVALRKAEKLLPFGAQITVIAPAIREEFYDLPLTCIPREFQESDVTEDLYCVIAACSDREVNRQISLLCQRKKIPVNVVDDPELCTFLFPSLVKSGPLTVGISTSGASPTAAIWIKKQLEDLLPENMEDILLWLQSQRNIIRATVSTEKQRTIVQRTLFAACMEQGAPLTDAQRDTILHQYQES